MCAIATHTHPIMLRPLSLTEQLPLVTGGGPRVSPGSMLEMKTHTAHLGLLRSNLLSSKGLDSETGCCQGPESYLCPPGVPWFRCLLRPSCGKVIAMVTI